MRNRRNNSSLVSVALSFAMVQLVLIVGLFVQVANAIPSMGADPSDPLATDSSSIETAETEDLETLITEAQTLFGEGRSIDARTKLQKALKIAPKDYRPHLFLGAYYLSEVGHFQLANKYLKYSETLFKKTYGSEEDGTLDPNRWQEHARLLLLLAEARLNLDDYKGALQILDRFGNLYWDKGYPGTRAWVLMKLKRVDEAIRVAQAGLLRGAEPGRTYNILGILFSLKDSRELALQSFARSIQAEVAMGFMGQVATPLNNSGEVYREMFDDARAEAAWLKAIQLPDGCEHILPSLNLAILYIDQLRLLQASRVLDDFEACFSSKSIREDTEHRSLLALARARIALRSGSFDKALENVKTATDRQQWFGKIGTNENDVRFASSVTSGQALAAKANALRREPSSSFAATLRKWAEIPILELRSWWNFRRARQISLEELNDFEDMWIRHTDAMLEYPTLGEALAGFPESSMRARVQRMIKSDSRNRADSYYKLYLGTNLMEHGDIEPAEKLIKKSLSEFRDIDRLARAEAIARLIIIKEQSISFWSSLSAAEAEQLARHKHQLFELLPSHFRTHSLRLPVNVTVSGSSTSGKDLAKKVAKLLTATQFESISSKDNTKYAYSLAVAHQSDNGKKKVLSITLSGPTANKVLSVSKELEDDSESIANVAKQFLDEAFQHREDPAADPVPELEILQTR